MPREHTHRAAGRPRRGRRARPCRHPHLGRRTSAPARRRSRRPPPPSPAPLLVHAPATFRRLGLRPGPAFDLLELFAFVLPARTAAPTPRGLALALDHDHPPTGLEAEAALLPDLAAALLHRLAQGRATPLNRDAGTVAARMGATGWGWTPFVLAALDRADAVPDRRRPESLAPAAGMGGRRAAAAALRPAGHRGRSPRPPRRHARPRRRATPRPVRLRRRRRRRLRPARNPRRPELRAGGGRHRHRQDARLPRARQRLGAEEPRRGLGQHLHPPPPAPDRRRDRPAVPRPGPAPPPRRHPQGPRELPVPAEPGRRGRQRHLRLRAAADRPARPDRPLGAGDRRRRPARRRPARLVRRAVRLRPDRQPGRPPRRVHPRRLPALAEMLRRAHHPPRPHRRTGGRQPRPGDDAGGLGRAGRQRRADPLRVRRGPPPVRRRRLGVLRHPLRPRDRRTAPLVARRGRRPVARPRPGAPGGGTGRQAPGAGDPAGGRLAGRPRAACAPAGPPASATKARNSPTSIPAAPTRPRRSCG